MPDTVTGKSKQGDHAALLSCPTAHFDFSFQHLIEAHFIITAFGGLSLGEGLQPCVPLYVNIESVITFT